MEAEGFSQTAVPIYQTPRSGCSIRWWEGRIGLFFKT